MLENRMAIDEEWGELEYGVKHETLFHRKARTVREIENEYRREQHESVRNRQCHNRSL